MLTRSCIGRMLLGIDNNAKRWLLLLSMVAEADEFKKYILGSIVQSDMVDRVINEVQTLQMTDLGPISEPFSVDQVAQATDDGYNAGLVIGPTGDYSIEKVKDV